MVAAGLEPLEPYASSRALWKCRCLACGKTVTPRLDVIRRGLSRGCKWCAGLAVEPDEAVEVMRGAGLAPLIPYPGAQKPWRCKCLECGAEVTPQYANVRLGQNGCKWCAGCVLSVAAAVKKMRAAGFEPKQPYPGMREPWECRCITCGNTVMPRMSAVIAGGGCRWCAGKVVDPDIATAVMRRADLVALVPYPGSGKPWRCRCTRCGSEVTPQYGMVRLGRARCGGCAHRGFDVTKPAIVYLATHQGFGAVKVGIGNAEGRRLDSHAKHGWEPVAVFPAHGVTAKNAETAILKWWRDDLNLPAYLGPEEMPQSGYTETAELDAVNIPETIRRIKRLAAG